MRVAPIPKNEKQRLTSLRSLGLLDTQPEKRFDQITQIATKIFNVPISSLTLVDAKREWFKSCQGLSLHEADRAVSFCGHALLSDELLVVPDTTKDSRFADNPMVTGKPYLRFYAGVPIISTDRQRVGALCIKDSKPRTFSKDEAEVLKGLAHWAEVEISSHNLTVALSKAEKKTENIQEQKDITDRLSNSREESRNALLNVMEDLKEANSIIEIEKAKDEAMLDSIGDGVVAVDNDRKIIIMNKAAEEILGYKIKDVLGKEVTRLPLEDEMGHVLPLNERPTYTAIVTGKPASATLFFVRSDGTRIPIAIKVTPIKLGEKVVGAIDIFRDVTQEKAIDKAKTEFVSLASHQLRTPLGIVKWYLEALAGQEYFKNMPAQTMEYFQEVYKNNERVLKLVRNLLSISRIDQGKVKDEPVLTNVEELARDIIKDMEIMAIGKKIKLNLAIEDDNLPLIMIDPLRLREVIENLVANAIEYNRPAGLVTVTIDTDAHNDFLISVADTGAGLTPQEQRQLFTKFYRSEKAASSNTEGSGLGLYLVKSYTEDWGGKVSVKSNPDKGSTFTIALPLKPRNTG